jgi:group I intron endonuclease
MMWAVYIITNAVNGKQYVGLTKDIKRRWYQHISANGSAPALHSAVKHYGKENFVLSHICDAFDFESACDIEKMLIQQHNTKSPNGYNLTDGGDGVVGRPMTNEDKEIRRKAAVAYAASLSPEERSKKFGGAKGRKWSPEKIKQISESNKGKNLGKKPSDETRKKMSEAHKARPRKPLSEETKKKISQSLLNRKMLTSTDSKRVEERVLNG